MIQIPNRMRDVRDQQQVSVSQLAHQSGVSRLTIRAVESGLYIPSLPLAVRLARALNHTVEDLFTV